MYLIAFIRIHVHKCIHTYTYTCVLHWIGNGRQQWIETTIKLAPAYHQYKLNQTKSKSKWNKIKVKQTKKCTDEIFLNLSHDWILSNATRSCQSKAIQTYSRAYGYSMLHRFTSIVRMSSSHLERAANQLNHQTSIDHVDTQNQFEKNCPCNYKDSFNSVDKLKSRPIVLSSV